MELPAQLAHIVNPQRPQPHTCDLNFFSCKPGEVLVGQVGRGELGEQRAAARPGQDQYAPIVGAVFDGYPVAVLQGVAAEALAGRSAP